MRSEDIEIFDGLIQQILKKSMEQLKTAESEDNIRNFMKVHTTYVCSYISALQKTVQENFPHCEEMLFEDVQSQLRRLDQSDKIPTITSRNDVMLQLSKKIMSALRLELHDMPRLYLDEKVPIDTLAIVLSKLIESLTEDRQGWLDEFYKAISHDLLGN